MLKQSELYELGLEKQAASLFEVLHIVHDKKRYALVHELSSLPGMRVNDSFFDVTEKHEFNYEEIEHAFLILGVILKNVPGKKWYQFWKDDWQVKVVNALKLLP